MEHLTGMDATFLHLETPEMPMHVGSLMLLDLPPDYEGDFYENVKAHFGRRLHLAKVFQRKLALMPFELTNPVWVDDEDVDLDHHIRHVMLPRPGTHEQIEKMVGRLHSPLLDRSRPLWEVVVISGLASGQVAVYSKVHHAAIDGQAGVALAKAVLDLSAEPRKVKPPRPRRLTNRYQLGVAELAAAATGNLVQQYIKLARSLPAMLGAARDVLMPLDEATGRRQLKRPGKLPLAPRTPLNVSITNARAFAMRSVPLEHLKQIARTGGFSLNDVVLAVCAGALKRYLADYEALPKKPLVAAVPVSLREQGNADMNNQVSFMTVSLATDRDDPLERLKGIRESADAGKQVSGRIKGALPMDFPSFGVPWLMTGLVSLYGRSGLANRMPQPGTLVISNVPGPQMPLYLAGAAIRSYAPVSIPAHGMALNVTVQSYNGSMEFGLIACRRAVPDVADLADYMMREIEVLARATDHAAAQVAEAVSTPAADQAVPNRRRAKAALKLLPKQAPDVGEPPRRASARGRRQAAAT